MVDRRTGATHRLYRPGKRPDWRRRTPIPTVDAAVPPVPEMVELAADDLRTLVLDLLASSPTPVRVCELVDVARALGGRADLPSERRSMSQAVSNLLRPEVAAGRVERLGRGRYRWVT